MGAVAATLLKRLQYQPLLLKLQISLKPAFGQSEFFWEAPLRELLASKSWRKNDSGEVHLTSFGPVDAE